MLIGNSVSSQLISGNTIIFNDYFFVDNLSYYMCLLVIIIAFIVLIGFSHININNLILLVLSCLCAIGCFCSWHCISFWVFYELSIISILFLVYMDSPYSDRYIAGWYFSCYMLFCGLPMLMVLVYCGESESTYYYIYWSDTNNFCLILLILLFVTKIPLVPFHVWLPIVHAEASTITSVCLSGYIMKLGLAGVIRFGVTTLEINYFSGDYLLIVLVSTIIIFISCLEEVDFKRWLAMLSLSHIGVGVVCLYVLFMQNTETSLLFGLGHGVAASYFFLLIMFIGVLGGSRAVNTVSLTSSWSFNISWLLVIGLCFCASFPPFVNFFIEVWLVGALYDSYLWYVVLLVYLFFSSVIPFSILGLSLTRRGNSIGINIGFNYYTSFLFLLLVGLFISLV
uniref:NADH-ubiquinone oxidoreductase chain 4 n=1 Tax=Heterobothrium okamotoi TaxID=263722 RepID=A0A7U0M899_9PLAT|nr:NADH dehydrogenase subunit 4 [Heterobothrium okamotoi]QQX28225.1 NADH dehydrogenase subunit 4 [Heterobothrium okamotoi]